MTGKDYIDALPKKLGDKIFRNIVECSGYETYLPLIEFNYYSFGDFIMQAFVWSDTPEGHEYWSNICITPLEELCDGFYIKKTINDFVFN